MASLIFDAWYNFPFDAQIFFGVNPSRISMTA